MRMMTECTFTYASLQVNVHFSIYMNSLTYWETCLFTSLLKLVENIRSLSHSKHEATTDLA